MGIKMDATLEQELIELGLASADTKTVTVTVSSDETPAKPKPVFEPGKPKYIEPAWYPRLKYALTQPGKSGACLFGPRGTGKTTAVHRISDSEKHPLVTFQAATGCTIDDLVGMRDLVDGKTIFTDGPLVDALKQDAWLLIEEANVMHPGVFSKLNTLTDGSGDTLRLPDGTRLRAGPKFRVVLAFNEGGSYSGTRDVNAALRDRLMPIYATYLGPSDELEVLTSRTGIDKQSAETIVKFAAAVRAAKSSLGFDLSPRALFNLCDLMRDLAMKPKDAFEVAILDLIGDPSDKRPQRDAVNNIANTTALFSIVAKFGPEQRQDEQRTAPVRVKRFGKFIKPTTLAEYTEIERIFTTTTSNEEREAAGLVLASVNPDDIAVSSNTVSV